MLLLAIKVSSLGLRGGRHRHTAIKVLAASASSVSVYDGGLFSSLSASNDIIMKVGHDESREEGLMLRRSEGILELAYGAASALSKKEKPFHIDFSSPQARRRQKECKKELVVKAMGKPDLVVDMTAGLGRDASLCAASGLQVLLVERNWVLYQLLQDGIQRLSIENPDLASRMAAVNLDAGFTPLEEQAAAFLNLEEGPLSAASINVYLDPMYPPSKIGRKSAVKKDTQVLHRIVGAATDGEEDAANELRLFERAMQIATDKVVVKRPLNSAPLVEEPEATSAVVGSTHRFDVYLSN